MIIGNSLSVLHNNITYMCATKENVHLLFSVLIVIILKLAAWQFCLVLKSTTVVYPAAKTST